MDGCEVEKAGICKVAGAQVENHLYRKPGFGSWRHLGKASQLAEYLPQKTFPRNIRAEAEQS